LLPILIIFLILGLTLLSLKLAEPKSEIISQNQKSTDELTTGPNQSQKSKLAQIMQKFDKNSSNLSKLLNLEIIVSTPTPNPTLIYPQNPTDFSGFKSIFDEIDQLKKIAPVETESFVVIGYDISKFKFRVRWLNKDTKDKQKFFDWLSKTNFNKIPDHYFYFVESE